MPNISEEEKNKESSSYTGFSGVQTKYGVIYLMNNKDIECQILNYCSYRGYNLFYANDQHCNKKSYHIKSHKENIPLFSFHQCKDTLGNHMIIINPHDHDSYKEMIDTFGW